MWHIAEAASAEDWAAARGLFEAYARSLDFDLEFQGFSQELATLPGDYAPPLGCILLARDAAGPVGCVALRPLGGDVCEMKRLFVAPAARGRGIGRQLAETVLERARALGYKRMRLDTVSSMRAAEQLYASLGFRPIAPYCFNPLPGARFYERLL
jgi:GNAT superfamily N-acetyltransferase